MEIRSKDRDYREKVKIGFDRMREYRVAICSIVRNCESGLKRNIPVLMKLRESFLESQVVIVENDSTDGTKDALRRWARDAHGVHVVSGDTGVPTIPERIGSVNPYFSLHRIVLMASYRNKYLDFLEAKGWELDYIIVVDLDIAKLPIASIANSFGQDIAWDVVASNGLVAREEGYVYFDTFAFRETGDNRPQTEEIIYTYQNLLTGLLVGTPMLRVSSAFGGLAIYRAEALRGLRYRTELNDDPNVEACCEHRMIHHDMSQNGHDMIFLNPSQIVYYDTHFMNAKSNLWRKASRLARLASHSIPTGIRRHLLA